MERRRLLTTVLGGLLLAGCRSGQMPGPLEGIFAPAAKEHEPRVYDAFPGRSSITVDGELNEDAWQRVFWTETFTQPAPGDAEPALASERVEAAILHEKYGIVVAFRCRDRVLANPYSGRDQPLWEGDSVGVFIDADRPGENIRALYVNPANDLTDMSFVRVSADGDPGLWQVNARWDDASVRSGAAQKTEIDAATGQTNTVWTVELAIPVRSATRRVAELAEGVAWRMQLIRTNIGDAAAAPVELNLWSPALLYFKPTTYGTVRFH